VTVASDPAGDPAAVCGIAALLEIAPLIAEPFASAALERLAALAARACACEAAALVPAVGGPVALYPSLLPEPLAPLLDQAEAVCARGPLHDSLPDGTLWAGAPVSANGRRLGALLVAKPVDGGVDTVLLAALSAFAAPLIERALGERRGGPAGLDAEVLLDSLSDPAALIAVDGAVLAANPPMRALMTDAGAGDLASTTISALMPRGRNGRAVRPDERLLTRIRKGRSVRAERVYRMPDGRDRAFAITASPLRGANGDVEASVLVLREFSETIERERALRLMQEARRDLSLSEDLRSAAKAVCRRAVALFAWVDMAAVFTLDGDVPSFLAQSGFPPRAARLLASLPLGAAHTPLFAAHDGHATAFQAHLTEPGTDSARQVVAATGAATFVNLALDAGARRFGVLTLVARAPHQPTREELALLESLALQIGAELEGVRRREQAEGERARLQAVVDQLPEGILLFDAAGRLTMANRSASEILGGQIDRGAMLQGLPGRLGLLRADGRDYRYGDDPLARTFSSGRAVLGEEALLRPAGGAEKPIVLNVAPVRDGDGELTAVIMIFQDITTLREMDRQKDEFISIAGHELRTPLTGIQGFAQFLVRRYDRLERATVIDALTTIAEQTDAMATLVDELLDVSRIRTGRLALERAPCDLVELTSAAVERLQAQRGGPVVFSASTPAVVNGDARRLTQVLTNLLDNAAKYSPPDAPVAVAVETVAGVARVVVRDRGIGIPADAIGRLFERFYRADNASVHAGGLGIGLYLCQEIVELHGGGIDVRSVLGAGTEFTVRLPLAGEKDEKGG
jgi:PAS domain S-box-containing protein